MSVATEHEILREARAVLRKLVGERARLTRCDDGRWTIIHRGEADSGRIKARATIVAEFRRRGWLAPTTNDDTTLVLTDLGRRLVAHDLAGGNVFADRHRVLAIKSVRNDAGEEALAAVNEAESPLGWLRVRGQIDAAQHEAGERLRRDYTIAQLEPRLGVDLSVAVLGSIGAQNAGLMTDAVLAAKQRFSRAMSAVGPGLSDLLFDVCCALKGLEAIETANDWPKRSGKVVLRLALDRLAAHYGISIAVKKARVWAWNACSTAPKELTAC